MIRNEHREHETCNALAKQWLTQEENYLRITFPI